MGSLDFVVRENYIHSIHSFLIFHFVEVHFSNILFHREQSDGIRWFFERDSMQSITAKLPSHRNRLTYCIKSAAWVHCIDLSTLERLCESMLRALLNSTTTKIIAKASSFEVDSVDLVKLEVLDIALLIWNISKAVKLNQFEVICVLPVNKINGESTSICIVNRNESLLS